MKEEEQNSTWQARLFQLLPDERYQHSLRVACLARELAQIWQLHSGKAYTAGLLHDMGRSLSAEELLAAARQWKINIGPAEKANPTLLHAPVGARLLIEDWGLADEEIAAAVAGHTIARAGMKPLDKVVFLADLLEPERNDQDLDRLRALVKKDLDQAMLIAINRTLAWLQNKKYPIHPDIWPARHYFRRKISGFHPQGQ